MFHSTLLVNVGDNPDKYRPGRLWVQNVYRVHQRLCMAFPTPERSASDPRFVRPFQGTDFRDVHAPRNGDQGFLFRIDVHPRPVILVRSAREPAWDYAFHNASFLIAAPPQVQKFSVEFLTGQQWRFRLRANPTVKRNGNREAYLSEDLQRAWFERKAQASGFKVLSLQIAPEGWLCFTKGQEDKRQRRKAPGGPESNHGSEQNNNGLTFFAVEFQGLLELTDPKLVYQTLEQGIGSAKSFGFGLLSLAPAS